MHSHFVILQGRWVGYHCQEHSTKFDNRSKRKVEKFKNHAVVFCDMLECLI
jgi:hypothetical protein